MLDLFFPSYLMHSNHPRPESMCCLRMSRSSVTFFATVMRVVRQYDDHLLMNGYIVIPVRKP